MKSFRFIPVITAVIVFLFAVFFWRDSINAFVFRSREIFSGLFDGSFSRVELVNLRTENNGLRAILRDLYGFSSEEDGGYTAAGIYSRYPLNDRRQIVINLGWENGLKEGTPVFAAPNVLLGRVISVRKTQATVETVFDPEWRQSVVLESGPKALLKGGTPPTLELISKEKPIAEGNMVLNVSPEYPFHAYLGSITSIESVPNEVWQRGKLKTPYELDELNSVLVAKNFP
ncbi:MAG TPA: rod shape-determining protein MreC [Candidatus Paceibacterota bacterium]|nr:rod shape-determining protein MreC [Candidatus Paceibacterota bacterium]